MTMDDDYNARVMKDNRRYDHFYSCGKYLIKHPHRIKTKDRRIVMEFCGRGQYFDIKRAQDEVIQNNKMNGNVYAVKKSETKNKKQKYNREIINDYKRGF